MKEKIKTMKKRVCLIGTVAGLAFTVPAVSMTLTGVETVMAKTIGTETNPKHINLNEVVSYSTHETSNAYDYYYFDTDGNATGDDDYYQFELTAGNGTNYQGMVIYEWFPKENRKTTLASFEAYEGRGEKVQRYYLNKNSHYIVKIYSAGRQSTNDYYLNYQFKVVHKIYNDTGKADTIGTETNPRHIQLNTMQDNNTHVTSNAYDYYYFDTDGNATDDDDYYQFELTAGNGTNYQGMVIYEWFPKENRKTTLASFETYEGRGEKVQRYYLNKNSHYIVKIYSAGRQSTNDYYLNYQFKVAHKIYKVSGISLNKKSANVTAGKTIKLEKTVNPKKATNKKVSWTSSDKKIATVDNSGTVKGIKPGTVTITAKTEDGGKTATCTVTVKPIAVTGVTLDKTSATLTKGSSLKLTQTVSPSNASDKGVTWSSSNTKIATVDANGNVKAVKSGTATITVKTKDGGKTATCKVTVKTKAKPVLPSSVKIEKKTHIMNKGATRKVNATVEPANTADKTLTWSSSNSKVATVDANGNVKAVNHGIAKITAKTTNGKTASCEVRVNFADVRNTKSWYYKGVYWASEKGIVTGSGGYFQPGKNCTREQAITMLWRLAGEPEPKSMNSKFKDVKNTKRYSYKAIMWGSENGIITGTKGRFYPTGTCTREQIVTMLWRWAGRPEPRSMKSNFKDVKNTKRYSYKAILWANEKEIAKGTKGKFSPTLKCKRRDIVTFIYRYKN